MSSGSFNWLVGWLVLFYSISILFRTFNAELSHFDKGLHVWFHWVCLYDVSTIAGYLMQYPFSYI